MLGQFSSRHSQSCSVAVVNPNTSQRQHKERVMKTRIRSLTGSLFLLSLVVLLALTQIGCDQFVCSDSSQCTNGQVCMNNACVPNNDNTNDPCANVTCQTGETCRDGACVSTAPDKSSCKVNPGRGCSCEATTECPSLYVCLGGTCTTCTSDDQCRAGRPSAKCVKTSSGVGFCRSECEITKECQSDEICNTTAKVCAPKCTRQEDCADDEYCTQNVCRKKKCSSKNQCNAGEICVDEKCVPGCDNSDDCPKGSTGAYCQDQKCVPGCQSDSDCGADDKYCSDEGQCVITTRRCSTAKPCPQGQACSKGYCKPSGCNTDSDCGDGSNGVCKEGRCYPKPGTCNADKDCPDTSYICKRGVCEKGCRNSRTCPALTICDTDNEKCVPGACKKDADCPQGYECRQNFCREIPKPSEPADEPSSEPVADGGTTDGGEPTPEKPVETKPEVDDGRCETNNECKLIDPTKPVCQQSTGKCVECFEPLHCTGVKDRCVQNKCIQCGNNQDCKNINKGNVCVQSVCYECLSHGDCPTAKPVCKPGANNNRLQNKCVECQDSSDCTGNPSKPVCDTAKNVCIAKPVEPASEPSTEPTEPATDGGTTDGGASEPTPEPQPEVKPECLKDSDCTKAQKCTAGKCVAAACVGNPQYKNCRRSGQQAICSDTCERTFECEHGQWVDVSSSNQEICDGKDNNCDGNIDEGFKVGDSCQSGTGGCKAIGKLVCNSTQNGTVCDAQPSQGTPEKCNGKDDDCDGSVDEDFSNLGKDCSNGTGACKVSAKYVCKADGSDTMCPAQAKQPTTEKCNGIDDDCDGNIDNGVPGTGIECSSGSHCTKDQQTGQWSCKGTCKTGTTACDSNGAITCQNETLPTDELCDGLDNNCNDIVDDGKAETVVYCYRACQDDWVTGSKRTLCPPKVNGVYDGTITYRGKHYLVAEQVASIPDPNNPANQLKRTSHQCRAHVWPNGDPTKTPYTESQFKALNVKRPDGTTGRPIGCVIVRTTYAKVRLGGGTLNNVAPQQNTFCPKKDYTSADKVVEIATCGN